MTDYAVDRDVPIPKGKRGRLARCPAGDAGRALQIGESILFATEREAKQAVGAIRKYPAEKRKGASRKTRDGWRVWRTE